jgi:hypothetical protein
MKSQYSNSCDICGRSEFPNRAAFRQHIYRCRKKAKSSPKFIRAEPASQSQRQTEPVKILHPYSDEWDCAACLHRFSSLESAQDHYEKRHVQKIPYESDAAQQNQVEKPISITDQLNEMANQRAQELSQVRYAPREGIVKQQLFTIVEPREQAPIVESESEPRQESERPQSTAVIDIFKRLGDIFKGKNNQVAKEPQPEFFPIFMANRGVGVDGVSISWNAKPNYCKNCKVWLYDIEVQNHVELGHTVVSQ